MGEKMRSGLAGGLVLLAALASLAPTVGAADEAYEINAILPLTGGGAFLGQSVRATMNVTEAALNARGGVHGKPLRFVYRDDQSTPQIAVQLTNEIVAGKPAALIGSSLSAMCNAMAPLLKAGPVQYCLSPGIHPAEGSFTYTASVSARDYIEALLRYFSKRGWKRVAVLTTIDSSGQDADKAIAEAVGLPDLGQVEIVAQTHMSPSDISVSAQLENMRAAQPEAYIVWATGAAVATVFRGLAQAGVDAPVAASTSTMTIAQMTQYESFLPKQLYFATPEWLAGGDSAVIDDPVVAERQREYFRAMGAAGLKPDAASETAWDPLFVIAAALNAIGPGANAGQLRAGMAGLKGFRGIDGAYDFTRAPQRGIGISNTIVASWDSSLKNWRVVSRIGGAPLAQ